MATDPELRAHREWLGYAQPVGLVVSPPALHAAQAVVERNPGALHARFLAWVDEVKVDGRDEPALAVLDLPGLLRDVFNWRATDLAGAPGGPALGDDLAVALPEYDDLLRPTYAVVDPEPGDGAPRWSMLIEVVRPGTDLDALPDPAPGFAVSPELRFERLLRDTRVPQGLLCNGLELRLVYAPHGETAGYLPFPVAAMCEVAGRPLLAGLHLLLEADRVFGLEKSRRLPAILAQSRKYQTLVGVALAEQVLEALFELLRGFQAADDQRHGDLLREVLDAEPNHVYGGLLAVLLRLVFLLYAEERGMMPRSEVFAKHYAVMGLFERLKNDRDHHPDTIDQRYGAWAQLLSLFRLVFDGGGHGDLRMAARHGHLFDPDRYPFLEGRAYLSQRVMNERLDPPHVSDGVVLRVLERLMVLDGERISYRALDVEQIGSVYETIMGFNLRTASGRSIAVKAKKRHGAPAILDLEALLDLPASKRAKALKEATDHDVVGKALEALKLAVTPEDIVASLGAKVSRTTPTIVPAGAMVLEPSEERRRSGSHYTPRALTEPIVKTALSPILAELGPRPRPEAILALDVCDPAVGSGAFLVEACRQLGDALVASWRAHGLTPPLPPDEDDLLHARRLVAQRCLYGVDKNPLAVDLAKLSLWLATLARDHPFTFLDHAIKVGDSLVGLGREQIRCFGWSSTQATQSGQLVVQKIDESRALREQIQSAGDAASYDELRLLAKRSDDALDDARLAGDLVIAAFFAEKKPKDRERLRSTIGLEVDNWLAQGHGREALEERVEALHKSGVRPFHWEIEYPEVFAGKGGFDAIVGNPPFAGKNTIADGNPPAYLDWLKAIHSGAHGNSDLVAHFYRRAFTVIRTGGTFGLIATKTIRQGDTRSTGLRWICLNGGAIYSAIRRLKWPGEAAVVISIVHVTKGAAPPRRVLDGRQVDDITAYLFHRGGSDDPATLRANANKSFQGSIVLGMGFTFDDSDKDGVASPIAEMERLIAKEPRNAEVIHPFIGYAEVADTPKHAFHRYVISFGEASEEECRRQWPSLMTILDEKVRPERQLQKDLAAKERWWQFLRPRPELAAAVQSLGRVIVAGSQASSHFALTFLPKGIVYSSNLSVLAVDTWAGFGTLQSRVHEVWSRFFMSTMKDDLAYTPTTCFEPFPFPPDFECDPSLEVAGREYYEYRAALMVANNEGLTKTYNRFHDPDGRSPGVARLRELHASMDRGVLHAYGWDDVPTACDFFLEWEDEEEDEPGGKKKKAKKKPWRYRWPDEVHDEVLARLLELNRERAKEEKREGRGRGKKG